LAPKKNINKHLDPVFNVLLPKLEEAKIDYWVYGGISVAAFAGKFVRKDRNDDVDIFVKEEDFLKAKFTLKPFCIGNFKLKDHHPLIRGAYKRPKFDIKNGKHEGLSIVPIYLEDNKITLVFGSGIEMYSNGILNKVERNIESYRFISPRNEYIKLLFINYLRSNRSKVKMEDARAILTTNEFNRLYLLKD